MKKTLIIVSLSFLFIFCFSPINPTFAKKESEPSKVAIIIDDFGGNVRGVKEFFESDIPITVAVMPFMEKTKEQAELAHKNGLEVMLHLPLQPKKGKTSWLGPNPITKDLPLDEIKKRVEAAIDDVPHVKGINNHMGSLIVEDDKIMQVILEVVKDRGLYVIDSGTSGKSVIPRLAEELGIPWARRDTFLDDTHSSSAHVFKQMQILSRVAEKKGTAIGIGHVGIKGTETVKGVKLGSKLLEEKNIEIVPASHLLLSELEKRSDRFWQ